MKPMERKEIIFNRAKINPVQENKHLTEIEQEEFEKQFQVDPSISDKQKNIHERAFNRMNIWTNVIAAAAEKHGKKHPEIFSVSSNQTDNQHGVQPKGWFSNHIKSVSDLYYSEEERLKPENRYEDTWIIERDKDGKTKSFRSNGSTNVLVIETDGTEKFYKKPDGVSRADFFAYYAGIPIYKEDMDANRRSERVLRNAGFYSDGTKWYNTKDKKNEPTKKFDIYGNPFYENQPPQNKFEKQIYDKNQNLYKKLGRKITSLNGNVADLDNGTGKVLVDVPYKNQLKNRTKAQEGEVEVSGKNMCQLTSLAMVLESKGFCSGDKNRRLPDVLYDIAENENLGGNLLWNKTNLVYDKLHEKKLFKLKNKTV